VLQNENEISQYSYKRAGKMAKVKELERQYGKLAGSIRLARFTVPIDMTQVFKSGQELARKLSGLCPEETIRYLMHEQALLPQYANIKKHVSPGNTEPLLMDMPGTTIDDKGYPSRHFFTEEERLYHIRVQRFAQILKLKLPVIHGVVTVLIEKERISKDTLREYVRQNSWLGKELCRESPTPGPRNYCWWDLLEPSLSSYFHKVLPYVQDRTTTPDLIIEIDSLCLKFEGIVRDLLKLAGASTFRQKKDNEGRTITEEKELLMLFHEKKADSVFFEEDLFFLKFVLVEKAGYNLRSSAVKDRTLPNAA